VYIPKLLIDKLKLITDIIHSNLMNEILLKNEISENERYQKIIKPLSLIFRIYENIITGNFLQFYSIISMDIYFAQEIVGKLIDLAFILNIEEIDCYNKKFNSLFNVIFYLFSDLHIFIKSENQLVNLEKLFLFALDGMNSCNPCFSLVSFKIIFYFCKNFIELRNNYLNSDYTGMQKTLMNTNYFIFVYENFSPKFIFFLEKILKILLQGLFFHISDMSQGLLGLIVLFWDNFQKIILSLFERSREKDEKKNM